MLRKKEASSLLFPVDVMLLFAMILAQVVSSYLNAYLHRVSDLYLLFLSRPMSGIVKWFHVTFCLWIIGSVCLHQDYVEDYEVIDRFMGERVQWSINDVFHGHGIGKYNMCGVYLLSFSTALISISIADSSLILYSLSTSCAHLIPPPFKKI